MSEEQKVEINGFKYCVADLYIREPYTEFQDIKGSIERTSHIDVYMYCPNCNTVDKDPAETDVVITTTNRNLKLKVDLDHMNFTCKCPKCKSDMVPIDRYLIEPIALLNNFGYRTIESCQGHCKAIENEYDDNDPEDFVFVYTDTPYIEFDNYYHQIDNIVLPEGWELVRTHSSVVLDNRAKTTITSMRKVSVLTYTIPDDLIDKKYTEILGKTCLTREGFEFIGLGIPVRELLVSIKDYVFKN